MARYFVYPYKQGSKGAKALASALEGRVLRRQGSSYVPRQGDVIINWGDGQCPSELHPLNAGPVVAAIANKRVAFGVFQAAGVPVPAFALERGNVSWDGLTVVRHKLTGHSGEGIELVEDKANLPTALLYVEYIKKEQEYRVHVGIGPGGEVITIAVQRKARRTDFPAADVNWKIRNHHNGFVFAREGFVTPPGVVDAARQALVASGLDFGAVDVIYNSKEGKAYVLEINTAPGLEGQTVIDYATFFKGGTG